MKREKALEIKEILLKGIVNVLDEKIIEEYNVYYDFEDRHWMVSLYEDDSCGDFFRITLSMGDVDE